MDPENWFHRDTLAWTLFRCGEYQKAIAEMELSLKLAPEKEKGNQEEALSHLRGLVEKELSNTPD